MAHALWPATQFTQRGYNEDVECDQRRGWIAWECKHRLDCVASPRNCSECSGLSGFDSQAAKMYGSAEMSFDDRFEQVGRAHRRSAGGDEDVGAIETFFDGFDMSRNPAESIRSVWRPMRDVKGSTRQRLCLGQQLRIPGLEEPPEGKACWCPIFRPKTNPS